MNPTRVRFLLLVLISVIYFDSFSQENVNDINQTCSKQVKYRSKTLSPIYYDIALEYQYSKYAEIGFGYIYFPDDQTFVGGFTIRLAPSVFNEKDRKRDLGSSDEATSKDFTIHDTLFISTKKSKIKRLDIMLNISYPFFANRLLAYVGLGYGYKRYYYQYDQYKYGNYLETVWVLNTSEGVVDGLALEAGAIARLGRITFRGGITSVWFHSIDFVFGLGYAFNSSNSNKSSKFKLKR